MRRTRSNSQNGSFAASDDGISQISDNNILSKDSSSPISGTQTIAGPTLVAVLPPQEGLSFGRLVNVKIIMSSDAKPLFQDVIASQDFVLNSQSGNTSIPNAMGDDGNLFYCDRCHQVGDVVCCDGCPRVYHNTCIPENSKSRVSLDNDDDPWYCPTCMNEEDSASPINTTDQRPIRSKRICAECHQSSGGLMGKCKTCNATMHVPTCRDDILPDDTLISTCSNCVAKLLVDNEEDDKMDATTKTRSKSKISQSGNDDYSASSSDITPLPPTTNYGGKSMKSSTKDQKKGKGKSRPRGSSIEENDTFKRPPKKNKKESDIQYSLDQETIPTTYHNDAYSYTRNIIEETTSPFFFYLVDNRIRIERHLNRKNRSFKKLKGYQRNLMLSKEGALMWNRITKAERQKYIDMSLEEFEYNVMTWKEDETLREMMLAQANQEGDHTLYDNEFKLIDMSYWSDKFKSLVAPSKVGSRKIKNFDETIQNEVLLELLQDSRFHSLPMMKGNRENECNTPDYSMTAVPHFNIQGPVSTSIGDGCIGCVRGWNHFCPIVHKQLPAVEHRAKLQPPCPSLLPIRVGIGIPQTIENDKNYSYNEKKTHKDLRFLSNPNTRGDEIIQLVETAMAVKLPLKKINRQQEQDTSQDKEKVVKASDQVLFECGRCKTNTLSNLGCVTCRRVKLLVDLAKKTPGGNPNLSIQTVMLGRSNSKTDDFYCQTNAEKKIAERMIRTHWKPNAILPPMKNSLPPKNSLSVVNEESSECDDDSSTSSDCTDESSSLGDVSESSKSEITSTQETEDNEVIESSEGQTLPKRTRLTRSLVTKNIDDINKMNEERQELAMAHKEEANMINAKCRSIAICGILLAMIRRDPLRLFAEPVPKSVEGYHKIIKKPMDFSTMKEKVLSGQYSSLSSFMSDARLLCINSLVYNPPGTIYSVTAEEIQSILDDMQKRASKWIYAIKNAHASHYTKYKSQISRKKLGANVTDCSSCSEDDPFHELRKSWPGAVELFEDNGKWLRSQVESTFLRTRENESAYYAALAVRRAAYAAEASLSPLFESDSIFTPCTRRSHSEDEALRAFINKAVSESSDLGKINSPPTWREQDVLEFLKKIQKRRVEMKISPDDGCARCDPFCKDDEANKLSKETSIIRRKRKEGVQSRIAESRKKLSNGMASKRERDRVLNSRNDKTMEARSATARERSVTVRGSGIQGWGLFADHSFKKGDLVAEYVGEYVVNPMADKREKFYEERRIQDYQFRVSANLVIDATKLGGHARYINHSCDPSCVAKIIDGDPPNKHLKRVVVISQRDIQAGEEITYDYQFPLELDLDARIPCNCGSKICRGFMNWDLPELGSLVARATARQGRRDRIRRLVNKSM